MFSFGVLVTIAVTFVIGICLLGGWIFQSRTVVRSTIDGAKLAVETIGDWSKWMAGIETAAIAGVAYVCSHAINGRSTLTELQTGLAAIALAALGIALLSVGWILSSLSSVALRIYSTDSRWIERFDIHGEKMYARGGPKLSFVVTSHHWFWACGLIAVGALVVARATGA